MKAFHFIAGLFLLVPAVVCGQQTAAPNQADSTLQSSPAQRTVRLITFRELDQRIIYNWKNGQRSTPSGRQADSPNAKYVRTWGDSAEVVFDPDPRKEGK